MAAHVYIKVKEKEVRLETILKLSIVVVFVLISKHLYFTIADINKTVNNNKFQT